MPNTLVHLGVQTVMNSPLERKQLFPWVFLSCMIPDVPWILGRLTYMTQIGGDPIQMQIYSTVQASLVFSMLFSLGLALFAKRILTVWALLAANCALHLLLDAVEIKPGNGVHLLAPFSWQTTSFGWIWPEHWAVTSGTVFGALLLLGLFARGGLSISTQLVFTPGRSILAAALLATYMALPLAFMEGPIQANNRYVGTILDSASRAGKPIAFDRNALIGRDGRTVLKTNYGEFDLIGDSLPSHDAVVSVQGNFLDDHTIRVTDIHISNSRFRDIASMIGLAAIALIWLKILFDNIRISRQPEP